jgi:glutathione S-transferase
MTNTNPSLVFFTHPQSRGRVVRWMLEEIGCPYETKLLEYSTTMKAPEYLAINPAGKVPAIKHGSAVVTETVAICTYLADIFPEAELAPDANAADAKADYYRWLFFVSGPLEAAVANKSLNVTIPPEMKRAIGHGGLEEVSSILQAALKDKDFIAGNHFTAADLILSSYLGFYKMFGILPPNAEVERYVRLHQSRPAFLSAQEIDDTLSKAVS